MGNSRRREVVLSAILFVPLTLNALWPRPAAAARSRVASATQLPAINSQLAFQEPFVLPARPVAPQAPPGASAREVRSEFLRVLGQYPSTLRDVLRIDPVLMTDENYMALYPALAAFLDEHPEVVRNPSYFVGSPVNSANNIVEPIAIVAIMATIALFAAWLLRTGLDYVRWNRHSRLRAEIHAKLLDRFTANQELLAYVETPAGKRFLESTSVPVDKGDASMGAPIRNVMLSVRAGLVLALGGAGLYLAIPRIADPGAGDVLYVMAIVAFAIGIGFILAAGSSLVLSRRLGLIRGSGEGDETDVGS